MIQLSFWTKIRTKQRLVLGYIGFSMYPCGFSVPQIRQFCLFTYPCIHTYIIGHYNPSVMITDLVSHTTYVVCVNFIHEWRDLQFKVNSERQLSTATFFIYSQSFCQISAERGNRRRNNFYILFWCLALGTNPGFSSNKPTHYLLDQGDLVLILSHTHSAVDIDSPWLNV